MKKGKQLICWFGLLLVLIFSFKLMMDRSLSFHFVDEEDHMAGGDYINQGLKLYQDLSTNHQPLVYLGSSLIQKITKPPNMLMLIKRHRQAIFVYSLVWGILLVWRFKELGLASFLLMEGVKYFWLGNLWLMESLALYPAMYLLGTTLELAFKAKKLEIFEAIILGLASFLVIFNLVPLWPWLLAIWLVIFSKSRKGLLVLLATVFLLSLILATLVSPTAWFREVIGNNYVYAIPKLSKVNTLADWLKLLLFPFQAWLNLKPWVNQFLGTLLILWLAADSFLNIKNKKVWGLRMIGVYGWLFLANNRVLETDKVYYSGFHLLPWVGLLVWISLFWIGQVFDKVKGTKHKLSLGAILAVMGVWLLGNRSMPWFSKTDVNQEYYINYSKFEDINFVVKSLASPGDRLAVLTSEPLIYWQSKTLPATKQIVYYAWQSEVPALKAEYDYVFSQNPPEFIYGGGRDEMKEKGYINILKTNQPTELYIRQDKADSLTPDQLELMAAREFK